MRHSFALVLFLFAATVVLAAQSAPAIGSDDAKGFTSYVQFSGNANSSGHVLKLDSSVGYDFNRHFGIAAGVPIYFAETAGTSGAESRMNNGFGNPYLSMRFTFQNPIINYQTFVTGYVPLADSKSGFSTGRFTVDWTNHFDRTWSRLTPFVDVGIGNTITDSRLFDRPYTSLGFNTHAEGGASVSLSRYVSVGTSAYAIIPSGQQTIYSKLVNAHMQNLNVDTMKQHSRVFESASQVTGTADIARDRGFSVWVGASPNRYLDFQVGFTRSTTYNFNTVAFNFGINVGRIVRQESRNRADVSPWSDMSRLGK